MLINSFFKLLVSVTFSLVVFSCNNTSEMKTNADLSAVTVNPNGRNDDWGFIGPGGGGAMFNPAINPANTDHAFVSCDMTGSYVTYDGGNHWRMFNLRGVTQFYSFDRKESNIVYAGTSLMLFKSSDRGTSWHVLYPNPSDIIAIQAQGDHADEVVITADSTITRIIKLAVDPADPKKLFLLVDISKPEELPGGKKLNVFLALLVSNDGGENWLEENKFDFEADNIFIDPTSPPTNRILYLSGKKTLRVRKNGEWDMVNIPEGAGLITQYADGLDTNTNQHIIYAISGQSYFNPNGSKNDSRIYKTDDGGKTWNRLEKGLTGKKTDKAPDPEFRSIAVCYYHPENIYISYDNLHIDENTVSFGVAKSMDYGNFWELVWNDKATAGSGLNAEPISPNRESGWLDERFGPWWSENPFHMSVADHDPNICYATDFGRTIKTIDGGNTWQQVYTNKVVGGGWRSRGLQVTTGYMLAFDPFDSLHILMADTDTGLMESFDGGKSWSSATFNNGVPRKWVNSTYWVAFDPENKGKVWAVMSGTHDLPRPKMWRHTSMDSYKGGVLVSDNGGRTWKVTSKDIGESALTHILIDPESDIQNRTLYVCGFGNGVYKSVDGGKSWQQKNRGIEGNQPATWRITRRNDGQLFLIVSRKSEDGSIDNERDGALYRSANKGETWLKMKLPKGVNGPTSLMVDPENPNRLFLSTWGRNGENRYAPNRGGGIYVSEDDGHSWTAVFTHDQHIHDLTMDNRNGVFYACGFNSSAYRSEDKGYTWKRLKGYNFKWGKRIQPDPVNPDKIYIITFGGGVWHGPAKGDEKALEDIATPLAY